MLRCAWRIHRSLINITGTLHPSSFHLATCTSTPDSVQQLNGVSVCPLHQRMMASSTCTDLDSEKLGMTTNTNTIITLTTPHPTTTTTHTTHTTPGITNTVHIANANLPTSSTQTTKKKARYSRQQKREHKFRWEQAGKVSTSNGHDFESSPAPPNHRPPLQKLKAPSTPLTWQDRVFRCIRDAELTRSIFVEGHGPPPPMPIVNSTDNAIVGDGRGQVDGIVTTGTNANTNGSTSLDSIRLVTCSSMQSSLFVAPPAPGLTIRVKPLLILDLNGVLCHRRRLAKEPPGVHLRPSVGKVAGTPIIIRNDLESFLLMLQQHFCLAIWTSAKAKTARALLHLLLPIDVQKQLLFVWAQHHCDAIPLPGDTLFQKDLSKVWKAYPLWNANNTLLMDDSPEKCPFAPGNAIHPPPIHGQWTPPTGYTSNNTMDTNTNADANNTNTQQPWPWISDEYNESMQCQFFQQYIQHWHVNPFVQDLTVETVPTDKVNDDGATIPVREQMTNEALYNFLYHHGSGHMGWRGHHLLA